MDGVGDLKEYLDFFESFSDDPSLEEYQKFKEKHRQYYSAMRNFDYTTAPPEQVRLARQIMEKVTTVQTNVFAKKASARAEYKASERANTDTKFIYGPIDASPSNNEGGDQ